MCCIFINKLKQMKITIIGAGGVGGYFGGRIAEAGYDTNFVVRGKTLEAIQKNGLQVKSTKGDFVVHPKATNNLLEVKNADLFILGVKSWQVLSVAKQLKSILKENALVLPLQNGADNAEKLLSVLPEKNVLAGLCKIYSKVENAGIINHFAFEPTIVFGEIHKEKTKRIQQVKEIFDKAGIQNTISENIHVDIWRKFLFITMVSGIGAITRSVFGDLQSNKAIRNLMIASGNEIVQIANAKNIDLQEKDVTIAMSFFDTATHNTTASMQRDIMEGKPSELENFNGYIVQQGEILGIETPVNSFIYQCLLPQEQKARKNA